MAWDDRLLFADGEQLRKCWQPLARGQVHLWLVDIARQARAAPAFAAALSIEERAAAQAFKAAHLAHRYVVAHGALRYVLGAYLGIPPSAISLARGAGGKPRLAAGPSPPFFNLSHSEGLAAIAVTRAAEVGIDVEHIKPIPDVLDIARRYFTPAEYNVITATRPEHVEDVFFSCWTRKEAFVKATGEGFSRPLDSFCVDTRDSKAPPILLDGNVEPWSMLGFQPRPDYVGAIAVRSAAVRWLVLPPPRVR